MSRQVQFDCIYCLRRLPAEAFNREHVLSESFGKFRDALVLHDCVCRECNQYFGDNLEVRFTRASFEALLRYETGLKKASPRTPVEIPTLAFTLPGPDGWSGARLHLIAGSRGVEIALIPQVAFPRRDHSSWVHFSAEQLRSAQVSDFTGLLTSSVRVFAPSIEQSEELITALRRHGFRFERWVEMERPFDAADKVRVDVTSEINRPLQRCIAKYAFNFLAYTQKPSFVMSTAFDPVRSFIRKDMRPSWPVVVTHFKPILQDDSPTLRRTNGHLLTVNWESTKVDIVSNVSLFNYLTYSVQLARDFHPRIWRPIRAGVHFNLRSRTIEPFQPVSRILLP